ncbi:hypothetical protein B0H11DRAFT_2221663 [Mycena galericulata]|nr:hypothetical protein B0H11DRAFT_2221663 [Mycena galericulata]
MTAGKLADFANLAPFSAPHPADPAAEEAADHALLPLDIPTILIPAAHLPEHAHIRIWGGVEGRAEGGPWEEGEGRRQCAPPPPISTEESSSTAAEIALVVSTIACMAHIIQHVLLHTAEVGTFRSECAVLAEWLASLQLDVSLLREAALRDSLSYWATFLQFFKSRRTLAILRRIQEVRALEIHIEILKEFQLREFPLEAATAATARTISMRRRL